MRYSLIVLILISFIFTSGCIGGDREYENELTISAAISLSDAFREIGDGFQEEHPEVKLYFNFGASGTLMRQVEQGAEVDVFASASQREMDFLEEKDLILKSTRTNFANNRLVIIAPSQFNVEKLASPDISRIAIGNPKTVPAGNYAKTFLLNSGLFDRIQEKLIYAENVRQVVDYVELGEVDAGFVYLSDTLKTDFPVSGLNDKLYPEIVYPVAVIQDSDNIDTAKEFIEYIMSEEGQTILHKHGFV
jgi:molybdate transport system substrate-binding protein